MLIETQHLRKVYDTTIAVDDLTLSVGAGEIFGFLGPNGAGKTTTIKMLLGLVTPTAGEARILGHAPGDPAVMGRVGFLPEHFRFPAWLTAADFLDVHARLYGLPAAERRVRIPRLLAQVGLGDRARSKLDEFSKGMLQRVGLAQALLNDPGVVFLDEPTSGLDPLGRREVRDLIHELRSAGVTVFLNSHFLSEVEVTCDRVAIVKRGRVVRLGTMSELTAGATSVEIRAAGLTPELIAGLERWQVANQRISESADQQIGRSANQQIGKSANPRIGESANQPMADGDGDYEPACCHAERVGSPSSGVATDQRSISPSGPMARITLTVPGEDVLPEIAAYLVAGGARLYSLAPQRTSLEALFMRVMDEGETSGEEAQ